MPITLQQLIDTACLLAGPAGLKNGHIAELLLPQVFAEVATKAAADERLRHTLRRTKTVNVANGSVVLPTDTLSAYITDAVLLDPNDRTKVYTYLPWDALVREPLDPRLGHFTVEGESVLRVVEPGVEFDGSGPTQAYQLTVPCVPEVPTAPENQVAVSAEVSDLLVATLVRVLISRGSP
jgi:hypothetical protein